MTKEKEKVSKRDLIKLDFNVTNRCNLRCPHCCFDAGCKNLEDMSLKKIKEILEEFVAIGGQRIDITGGEPMMRRDIFEIIGFAKRLGIKTELVTNGTLLRDRHFSRLKDLGLDAIAISLDGASHKIYQKARGVDDKTFHTVLGNIKKSVQSGFYTKVNTVVFRYNLADLVNVAGLAISLGANENGYYYFSPIGRGVTQKENVAHPLAWMNVILTQLVPLKDKIKLSLETPVINNETVVKNNLKTGCFMRDPWHLQILPTGNTYPCAVMAAGDKPIGNIYKTRLKDLWQELKKNKYRYIQKNVAPLFLRDDSCVKYPEIISLIDSGHFKFACLCTKYKAEELM